MIVVADIIMLAFYIKLLHIYDMLLADIFIHAALIYDMST